LLSAGHAIIHDKIVVVDPLSINYAVITGSHNLGYKASYQNDENLLIIRGNRALAQAYAVHVMDVYDRYRFRYVRKQLGPGKAFSGFLSRTPGWQNSHFRGLSKQEMDYWAGP
jgi:phosphatidylserine/phosphatidylglycerophosphate/cardiolipin synthase-like enzyme